MLKLLNRSGIVFCLLFLGAAQSQAATITALTGYGQMTGPLLLNNFEASKDLAWVTFDATASLDSAASWVGGVTPSGVRGLVDSAANEPLTATLVADAYEAGLTFGNDDFNLVFTTFLSVYDAASVLLGTVTVVSNGNDFADQFIGLRSDTAFRRVEFRFDRPEAAGLFNYIDDFAISQQTAVPEPASLLLLGSGLVGAGVRRWRKARANR